MNIRLEKTVRQVSLIAFLAAGLSLVLGMLTATDTRAATAKEIDVSVDVAIERFYSEIKGGKEFLAAAKGVLVFPSVVKAAIGIGGEFGEGALRIGGKTVDYYNTAAGSFGLQIGAESKTIMLVLGRENRYRRSWAPSSNMISTQ